jgi:signal peptidase I
MVRDITEKDRSQRTFKEKFIISFYESAMSLVGAMVIILMMYTFGVKSVAVDGTSMVPTLQHGDRLVVTAFCIEPEQGDIIVSTQPNAFGNSIIKRVIATENQTVDINFKTGDVIVDGIILDEPYINNRTVNGQGVKFPLVVPENHIFVMGDNRQGSTDSRSEMVGFIQEEYIFGVAKLKICNYDKDKKEFKFYSPSEWIVK